MAYSFSKSTEEQFQWLLTRYPKKDAVLLPLLHLVQEEAGYLTPDAIDYVAERMGLSPGRIREVASFYSMFRLNKKGQYVLQICHNLSCYLRGSDELLQKCKNILGIKEGETTPDGKFTLERVECLASCGTAPVMQVNNWDFHENLSLDRIEKIIAALKENKAAKPSYEDRIKEGGIA
ncbi:MAG: NAD(P)H-dependent oxidoreductase subunit E [Bdellovibrionales bacterium]|nr:NAD(P)H-dependent oxidoreductase subunit E [Bdellovibrionales bacterium]